MSHLILFLQQILSWLINLVEFGFKWLWHELLGALIAVLNAIPVPAWLSGAVGVVGSIPPSVAFFLQAFELPAGLAIILGAYVIRFIIRRIPLVG